MCLSDAPKDLYQAPLFATVIFGVLVCAPFMRRLPFGTVRAIRSRRMKGALSNILLGIVTLMWLSVVGLSGGINTLSTPLR